MLLPILATAQGPIDPPAQLAPIAKGPFSASLESLKANRYPAWFTDGKLGIWAHWGPQAIPMEGDWYARQMYEEGSKDYLDHASRYGPPSQRGFKDIIPLWKAEKWDPERLMRLYKAAGARYFVSMGAHHDNFDLWDSTHQRWNSVKMGPRRDVVGDWAKAARKQGLRFGVSEHLGASWTWFQAAHGADKTGPLAGVPYDGADPAYEDLYHPKALAGDAGWYTTDPRWHREWYRRVKDLVDQHKPDLLYTDGPLPFGPVGEALVAHLYNATMKGGRQQAVYACKQPSGGRWAQDVERGVLGGIQEHPWQTDTSIGDWYYNKNWKYRGADWVLHTLIDVVSKNGNLLINVVQRPDGSLDPEAERILADMAAWMEVNSESIYGTRPWIAFGEGPTRAKGGAFKEDFAFTAKDVRYAQKGGALYATLLGRPEGAEVTLALLAKHPGDTAKIEDVELLSSEADGLVAWRQDETGLHITLPRATMSSIAVVLKIKGRDLRGFHSIPLPQKPVALLVVATEDEYRLKAGLADVHEGGLATETRDGQESLGFWDSPLDHATWTVDFAEPGTYEAVATVASEFASSLDIAIGETKRTLRVEPTGGWGSFKEVVVGTFEIAPGKQAVEARPNNPATWRPINLRGLVLRRRP